MTSASRAVTAPLGRLRRGSPDLGPKRIGALAVVLIVSAMGGYALFVNRWGAGEQEAPTYQIGFASRANVTSATNASGTVATQRQVKLQPVTAGRVTKLAVKQGDSVTAGQVIAEIDSTALQIKRDTVNSQLEAARQRLQALLAGATSADIAAQQQAVTTARSNLTRAQNDLVTLQTGATSEDVAAAQANLDRSRAALDLAQSNYDKLARGEDLTLRPEWTALNAARTEYQSALTSYTKLTQPNPADVATAQAAVNSAQASLDAALAKQSQLLNPHPIDIALAENQLSTAQAQLSTAQSQLANAQAQIPVAEAQIPAAQAGLDAARARYQQVFLGGSRAERDAAQAALDAAQAALDSAMARRAALSLTASPSEQSSADAAVAQAQSQLLTARQALTRLEGQQVGADISAAEQAVRQAESSVQNAQQGVRTAEQGVRTAEQAIRSAESAIATARANLDKLRNPGPADVAAAQQAVSSAQSALTSARNNLDKLLTPAALDVAQAQAALDRARGALDVAQTNWDRLSNGSDLAQRPETSALNAARADYQNALATYTTRTSGPKQTDIDNANAAIASAQAAVASATAKLAQTLSGPLATDVAQQQEAINQLDLSLKSAQNDLDAATIKAPFAGTITAIGVNEGDQAGASTALATLLDPNLLRIDATLDESSVSKVKAGQRVSVTFDAIPGQQYTGTVAVVTPAGVSQQGVVTFPISVVFDPRGAQIPAGSTATLRITTEQKTGVIAVPSRAIQRKGRDVVIEVQTADGKIESRTVVTGITGDNSTIEVVSGLNEGDRVVLPSRQQAASPTGGGAFGAGGVNIGGGSAQPVRR